VTSLHLQVYNGPNHQPEPDTAVQHLFGSTHLTESLLGYTFKVSPLAFFQVNTEAAEQLYSKVCVGLVSFLRRLVCVCVCAHALHWF